MVKYHILSVMICITETDIIDLFSQMLQNPKTNSVFKFFV